MTNVYDHITNKELGCKQILSNEKATQKTINKIENSLAPLGLFDIDYDVDNKHSILNFHSLEVYGRFNKYFKKSIPIIIESPVTKEKEIKREIFLSSMIRSKELNKNSNLNYTSRHLNVIEKFRAKVEDYEKSLKQIQTSKNK